MCRTAVRDRTPLLALLLTLCFAAGPATAQPGVPLPPLPYEPIGPEITVATDAGGVPHLATFADGSWLAAWRDGDGITLRARRYGADDQPLGAAFEVGPATAVPASRHVSDILLPVAVAPLDGDRWALVWVEPACDGCNDTLWLSLYAGATPIFERRALFADPAEDLLGPVLAADGVGRLAIAWTQSNDVPPPQLEGSNFADAYARLYDFDGDPLGDVFQLNETVGDEQNVRDATFITSGDLVFVWESWGGESTFYDVYQRLFDAGGQPLTGEARVNDPERANTMQFEPVVAPYHAGWGVVWTDASYRTTAFGSVVGRYFAGDGTPLDAEQPLSPVEEPVSDYAPTVAGDGERFLALWQSSCADNYCPDAPYSLDGSAGGVFASSTGPGGPRNTLPLVQVNLEANGFQGVPAVEATPGGFLAAWISNSSIDTAGAGFAYRVVARRFGEPFCEELCLDFDRFEVEVTWKDFQGNVGRGVPVKRDDDWGTFWFFRPDNVELAVKILDGRAINGHWWLFYAALTNVEYELILTDHFFQRGFRFKSYENASGDFASRGDTRAVPRFVPTPSTAAGRMSEAPVIAVPVTPEALAALPSASPAPLSPPARWAAPLSPATFGPCPDGAACLGADGRWAVRVEWADFFGNQGAGVGAPLTPDTGWFWFFRQGNPEMLVKVLDGRPVNGHWWVFYAALTNVGFTLHVTDRMTGETMGYGNPLGTFASMGDTEAFDG